MLPTLKLPSLAVLAGVVGNYWVVFQTHAVSDLKTAAVAAGTLLLGWANHQTEATKRNETDAAARLGTPPASAVPSVPAITAEVMRMLGHGGPPPAATVAGAGLAGPIPPGPHTL